MGTESTADIVPQSNLIDFVVPEPRIIKICGVCYEPLGRDSTS